MGVTASLKQGSRQPALPVGKALAGVLLLALVLRVVAACYWEARLPAAQKFAFPDSYSYWALGERIAAGEPYQFGTPDSRLFRTPGYPLLLAGVFRVAGSDAGALSARLVGAVLGTGAVLGIYVLAKRLFNVRTAQLAALLGAIYPGAIAISIFVLSEALFVPLMMLQFVAWVIAWQSDTRGRSWIWSGATGLAAAGATLARPSWLLFLPVAVAVGLVFGPARSRQLELGSFVLIGLIVTGYLFTRKEGRR